MLQQQEIIDIDRTNILNKAHDMKNAAHRLVVISALPDLTMLYCFEKNEKLTIFRFSADCPEPVESISSIYSYAFVYENEIKDLFGISIVNINLDFNGHFYKTAIKRPFRAVQRKVEGNE